MPKAKKEPSDMTAEQYQAARKKLKLSNYALAPKLGISRRQARRYESGETPIDATVALLIRCYLEHGLPR